MSLIRRWQALALAAACACTCFISARTHRALCGARAFWARGALCMAVSTLIMCTSALCVKLIGDRVPLLEIVVRPPAWPSPVRAPELHAGARWAASRGFA